MKLYYIGVLSTHKEEVGAKDLLQFLFFEKGSVGQFMTFFAETISQRTEAGQRQSVEEGNYIGHCYVNHENKGCVIISDKEYPVRPVYTLINKVLEDPAVTEASLTTYLQKYQDPSQADSILKVQQELDDTKIVLHKTIENVLQRGEKLDSLVDKSEALSSSSRLFYKQAKKTNSCCVLM